jgi:hypothetical protein
MGDVTVLEVLEEWIRGCEEEEEESEEEGSEEEGSYVTALEDVEGGYDTCYVSGVKDGGAVASKEGEERLETWRPAVYKICQGEVADAPLREDHHGARLSPVDSVIPRSKDQPEHPIADESLVRKLQLKSLNCPRFRAGHEIKRRRHHYRIPSRRNTSHAPEAALRRQLSTFSWKSTELEQSPQLAAAIAHACNERRSSFHQGLPIVGISGALLEAHAMMQKRGAEAQNVLNELPEAECILDSDPGTVSNIRTLYARRIVESVSEARESFKIFQAYERRRIKPAQLERNGVKSDEVESDEDHVVRMDAAAPRGVSWYTHDSRIATNEVDTGEIAKTGEISQHLSDEEDDIAIPEHATAKESRSCWPWRRASISAKSENTRPNPFKRRWLWSRKPRETRRA